MGYLLSSFERLTHTKNNRNDNNKSYNNNSSFSIRVVAVLLLSYYVSNHFYEGMHDGTAYIPFG